MDEEEDDNGASSSSLRERECSIVLSIILELEPLVVFKISGVDHLADSSNVYFSDFDQNFKNNWGKFLVRIWSDDRRDIH